MKNVFIVGLEDRNRELLEALPRAESVRFHGLLSMDEIRRPDEIPLREIFDRAVAELESFEGSIDAIAANWDFPVNMMVVLLRERFGLPTTSLESVMKCEHKLWSRLLQKEVVPGVVPPFEGFDPFDDRAVERMTLQPPYWVKPVIAWCSYLGFYIDDAPAMSEAVEVIRQRIGRIANPASWVLEKIDMPAGTGGSNGAMCMAEGLIAGRQCTVEGFVHRGRADVYGVVDSLRETNLSSFASYRYPSLLPEWVQARMVDAACRCVEYTGLNDMPFNVEFFWDERTDHVWLLEINTRLSESHVSLFQKLHGVSHQGVMVDLALGRAPAPPEGEGAFKVAGKFFVRRYADALVTREPSEEELAAIEADYPGTLIGLRVREGHRLSDLPDQDSYSYELAWVSIGARDHDELELKFQAVKERLRFEFEDVGERGGVQV